VTVQTRRGDSFRLGEKTTRWLIRLALVAMSAALSLAFPAPGLWWLGWLGLAPVIALLACSPSRSEAMKRSWFAGVGYLTALHYWVIPHTGIFTIVLAAFVGLFWLPFGPVCWWALGKHAPPARRGAALLVVPSMWVVIESVRSWEYLGGTWGLLGLSQWRSHLLLQSAALGGVWLLSFAMVSANTAIALAILPGRSALQRMRYVGVAAALPVLLAVYAVVRTEPEIIETALVAGVQPGVFDSALERLDAHLELTQSLERSDHDFVVWGQTSVALDPSQNPEVDARLREAAGAVGSDLFVNIDAQTEGGIVKTTVQYTSEGPIAHYGKRRLVPFGEYIPLRPLLGWVADYTEAAAEDRARGQEPKAMSSGGVTFGPLISYESTFPDMRRDLALLDVELTVVQGGTQTFQGTWAQPQQASYEAVNAVASGRPAILVAVSGVSAAFDGRGELLAWHPADWTGSFVVDIPLSQEETIYVRFGDWVVWLSVALVGLAIISGLRGRWVGRVR
jgi:apolipoprotein N-acyltransferase